MRREIVSYFRGEPNIQESLPERGVKHLRIGSAENSVVRYTLTGEEVDYLILHGGEVGDKIARMCLPLTNVDFKPEEMRQTEYYRVGFSLVSKHPYVDYSHALEELLLDKSRSDLLRQMRNRAIREDPLVFNRL